MAKTITTIQKRINEMASVKKTIDVLSLEHATKQREYNYIFKATKYEPNGNESKLELLHNYNVHISITRYSLKQLASKGNLNAMELLNNINHTVSIEDLQQEVLLWFVSNNEEWDIDFDGIVNFNNDESVKSLFTCISGYLRRFQTKHYKHQYIEIDGNIVDCNKVTELADYVSIDNLLENIELQNFLDTLKGIDKEWLELRLQGLSNLSISKELNVTYEKIRACEKRVRKMWNK